jgi:hypothetical protein
MKKLNPMKETFMGAAYHEAGHAVVAWRCRYWIRDKGVVVVKRRHGYGGLCDTPNDVFYTDFHGLRRSFIEMGKPAMWKSTKNKAWWQVRISLACPPHTG